MSKRIKTVIGWREWAKMPGLGIRAIKAKVDTGARTSCLHAFEVHTFRSRGIERVRFKVHPLQRDAQRTITAEAKLADKRWVRSSDGREMLRPVILTEMELMGELLPIELTLTNRDVMGFRMLLGRQALRRRFLVDVDRSYLAGAGPRSKKRRVRKVRRVNRDAEEE